MDQKKEIDLNRLHNFEFYKNLSQEEELEKVSEEISEFWKEVVFKKVGKKNEIIAEGLDVITAMLGYLKLNGLDKKSFEEHIQKLERYKQTKYKVIE